MANRSRAITTAVCLSLVLASCGAGRPAGRVGAVAHDPRAAAIGRSRRPTPAASSSAPRTPPVRARSIPLAKPTDLAPFGAPAAGEGVWGAAGRRVEGVPAVYETTLVPPGGSQPAGVAWMDTHLLAARLYSGSESPGGGPYRYTAAIQPASARYLVAAFNGGFKMNEAEGGYYTEGRMIDPLRLGAASLVIYADGSANVGAWGTDLRMTPGVVAVRQNLAPLVAGGRPTPLAKSTNWEAWGNTCGASSCAHSVPGVEHQWRSALGVTSDGALVLRKALHSTPYSLQTCSCEPESSARWSSTSIPAGRYSRPMIRQANTAWPRRPTATCSQQPSETRGPSSTPRGRATSSRCPCVIPCGSHLDRAAQRLSSNANGVGGTARWGARVAFAARRLMLVRSGGRRLGHACRHPAASTWHDRHRQFVGVPVDSRGGFCVLEPGALSVAPGHREQPRGRDTIPWSFLSGSRRLACSLELSRDCCFLGECGTASRGAT